MTTAAAAPAMRALKEACAAVGLAFDGAEPIRLAENQIWRLPGQQVVVRIARSGQESAAEREVRVARWLGENGIRAVRLIDVPQPVVADSRPTTFWQELPAHEHGSHTDVAQLLRRLHGLPVPDFEFGYLDPFVRIPERLEVAVALEESDRAWLRGLQQDLVAAWADRPAGLADCAIHGDAWPGNLVRTASGPLMIDLERFSLGPPEWDLVSTAVRARTTGAVTDAEYEEFCVAYGYDVTEWDGYEILAGARELRVATYACPACCQQPELG